MAGEGGRGRDKTVILWGSGWKKGVCCLSLHLSPIFHPVFVKPERLSINVYLPSFTTFTLSLYFA